MQQYVRSAPMRLIPSDAVTNLGHDRFAWLRPPVVGDDVPIHRRQPKLSRNLKHHRPSRSMRRPKQPDLRANRVFDDRLGVRYLAAHM